MGWPVDLGSGSWDVVSVQLIAEEGVVDKTLGDFDRAEVAL